MATIELPETNKVSPALPILEEEFGWRNQGDESYSSDTRVVRFMDNEYEIATKTCLEDYPSIEYLTIAFSMMDTQERVLRNIVSRSLEVSWESNNYVFNSLFNAAVQDTVHLFFPNALLLQVVGIPRFRIDYEAFDGYELSKDVADALHSFKNAVLNRHQRLLQKYLNECEERV